MHGRLAPGTQKFQAQHLKSTQAGCCCMPTICLLAQISLSGPSTCISLPAMSTQPQHPHPTPSLRLLDRSTHLKHPAIAIQEGHHGAAVSQRVRRLRHVKNLRGKARWRQQGVTGATAGQSLPKTGGYHTLPARHDMRHAPALLDARSHTPPASAPSLRAARQQRVVERGMLAQVHSTRHPPVAGSWAATAQPPGL